MVGVEVGMADQIPLCVYLLSTHASLGSLV